ncbi:hypothetical protein M0R19_06065 [Candidatus Pacearchaeota archaeon]|jgi:predicted RNA-binding Zn-ribbon protein involved in translation (DUF1610 family)|nr:hypothetical protein [Candidatus Pacearchaeota archaeon]
MQEERIQFVINGLDQKDITSLYCPRCYKEIELEFSNEIIGREFHHSCVNCGWEFSVNTYSYHFTTKKCPLCSARMHASADKWLCGCSYLEMRN